MAVSEKTKTVLSRSLIRDVDDLYPDRSATPLSDGTFPAKDTGSTYRLNDDEVPNTTKDMSKLFMWKHGDIVRGTFAKEHEGMKNYRRDINKAFGKESQYKDIYIDTLSPKIVSKQLEDFDNI